MAQTTGFVPPTPRFQLVVPETGPFAESNFVFDSRYQNAAAFCHRRSLYSNPIPQPFYQIPPRLIEK